MGAFLESKNIDNLSVNAKSIDNLPTKYRYFSGNSSIIDNVSTKENAMTKITVGEYATSRKLSESTVKVAIREKQWELERNPEHKRQRLLTLEQQAELDKAIPKATPPSAIPTVPAEVVNYHRPTEVGMTLAERALTVPEITYIPQTAVDNPLFQALQQRLDSMKAQNLQITQQVSINTTARQDTATAIDALKQMGLVQDAEAQAYRDFQLKQQAYNATMEALELQAAGLQPVTPQPSQPTPAGPPAAPPPQPTPTEYSKSPF